MKCKHNGKDIEIIYTAFPENVQGICRGTVFEKTDSYLIVIDSTRCQLLQRRSLGHELAHIYLDHFQSSRPIDEIEYEAKLKAWDYYRAYKSGTLAAMA